MIHLHLARVEICEEKQSTKRSLCLDFAQTGTYQQILIKTDLFILVLLGQWFVKKIEQLRDQLVWISL